MRTLFVLALGAAALYGAAKYYNLTLEDVKRLVPAGLKNATAGLKNLNNRGER
jgi:hypothetical protein